MELGIGITRSATGYTRSAFSLTCASSVVISITSRRMMYVAPPPPTVIFDRMRFSSPPRLSRFASSFPMISSRTSFVLSPYAFLNALSL